MENDNATGRYGSESYVEYGSERMCPMSEETGDSESMAYEREAEDQGLFHNHAAAIATLSAAFFASFIISIIVARMWNEDEIKLHVLDMLTRILQVIARTCGGWALACEKAYNDYANTLH